MPAKIPVSLLDSNSLREVYEYIQLAKYMRAYGGQTPRTTGTSCSIIMDAVLDTGVQEVHQIRFKPYVSALSESNLHLWFKRSCPHVSQKKKDGYVVAYHCTYEYSNYYSTWYEVDSVKTNRGINWRSYRKICQVLCLLDQLEILPDIKGPADE